jgi:hypothetical protein
MALHYTSPAQEPSLHHPDLQLPSQGLDQLLPETQGHQNNSHVLLGLFLVVHELQAPAVPVPQLQDVNHHSSVNRHVMRWVKKMVKSKTVPGFKTYGGVEV